MTDLNAIYLPVEKVLSDTIAPGYNFPSGEKYAVVVTKEDGSKHVVNHCSEIYHLVKNEDIIPPFLKQLMMFYEIETIIRTNGVSQFHVDFAIKNDGINIHKLDTIYPKIRLSNSYDGRIKYHFQLGFFRVVCTNGMTVPHGSETLIWKLHTPSLDKLTSYESVMEMTAAFIRNAPQLSEVYSELADHRVRNLQDRVEEVIEETRFPQSLQEDVMFRIQLEMDALQVPANDWLVYNGFNFQLNHNDSVKTKELKREEIDGEILEYLKNY